MSVLKTVQLTKRYGKRTGIENVNLELKEGDLFGFLGPNGAGKTTTIRSVLGFLKPCSGKADVFGFDSWWKSAQIKNEVGYLPGDVRLYSWMTTRNALAVFGKIRGRDLLSPGLKLAERLSLETGLRVRKMSRGTRQKLGLVLAMAHEPKLLILDEPTSGLDPIVQMELMTILRERVAAGATVFFSSHTLSEVEQLCNRIAIIRQGKVVVDETLESLRGRAKRIVKLTFENLEIQKQTQAPQFLEIKKKQETVWECELTGSSVPLIQWAASQKLGDILIGSPDLETLFHQYYQHSEGESSGL